MKALNLGLKVINGAFFSNKEETGTQAEIIDGAPADDVKIKRIPVSLRSW